MPPQLLHRGLGAVDLQGSAREARRARLSSQVRGVGFWDIRLMDKILHDPKDPKLWELWYIPYNG